MKASIFYIVCATLVTSVPLQLQTGPSQALFKRQSDDGLIIRGIRPDLMAELPPEFVAPWLFDWSAADQSGESGETGTMSQEQYDAITDARVQSNQLQGATNQIVAGSLGDRLVADAFNFDEFGEPAGLKDAATLKQEGWSDEQVGSLQKMDQDYQQAESAVIIDLMDRNPELFPAEGPPQSNPVGNPSANGPAQQAASGTPPPADGGAAGSPVAASGTAEEPSSDGGMTADQFNAIADARQESPEIQAFNQRVSSERLGDRPLADAFDNFDGGAYYALKDDATLKKEGWSDEQISSLKSLNDERGKVEEAVIQKVKDQNPKLFPTEAAAPAPTAQPADNPSANGPSQQTGQEVPGTPSPADKPAEGAAAAGQPPVSEQSSGQPASSDVPVKSAKPDTAASGDGAAVTDTPPANAAVPAPSGEMASPPEAATNPQALVSQPAAPVSAGASLSGVPTQAAQQQVNGNTGSNTNVPVPGASDIKQANAGLNPAQPAGQPALKSDKKPAVKAPTPQSAKLPTSQPAKVPAPKVPAPTVPAPKVTTPKAPAPKPASAPKTNSK
ncbi:hypothetical protein MIR68_007747 [Amoeboaphelidium protococcarum]|nr:hypothetical protein MIR68_007747 [Amoeboaphelidium protococcarum]